MQALILIDIQNDYFAGGANPLAGPDGAAANAARLLQAFRAAGRPVVHVQHLSTRPGSTFFVPSTRGAEIHAAVAPQPGEAVVEKHFPSSFRDTSLQAELTRLGARQLLIAGMMTHMCVDTTVRAAFDLGYECRLAHDACATRDLSFAGHTVKAQDVQAAYMAALGSPFATVKSTADWLAELQG